MRLERCGGLPKIGVPLVIIHFRLGLSLTKTIQLWGYPHDELESWTPEAMTQEGGKGVIIPWPVKLGHQESSACWKSLGISLYIMDYSYNYTHIITIISRQSAWLGFLYQPHHDPQRSAGPPWHPVIVSDWHRRWCTVLYTSAVFLRQICECHRVTRSFVQNSCFVLCVKLAWFLFGQLSLWKDVKR